VGVVLVAFGHDLCVECALERIGLRRRNRGGKVARTDGDPT
jgi:hypothetical protein